MFKQKIFTIVLVLTFTIFVFPQTSFSAFDLEEDAPGELQTAPPEENKTSGISLSGSANYLAKFLSATGLGDSILYELDGNVGVGTTNPISKFVVNSPTAPQLLIDTGTYGIDTSKQAVLWLQSKDASGGNWRNGVVTDTNGNFILKKSSAGSTDPNIDALVINNSGNVGIGKTDPGVRLDILPSNNIGLRLSGVGQGALVEYSRNGGAYNFYTGIPNFGDSVWQVQDNDHLSLLSINYNGNVGIGSVNPVAKLHVLENSAGAGEKLVFSGRTDDSTKLPAIQLSDGTTGRSVLGLRTGDIAVDNSGNVGIGTNFPNQKLTIAGGGIKLDNNQFIIWRDAGNSTDIGVIGYDGSNKLNFRPGATERMTIDGYSGYVGIGTTGPGSKLDVAGNVNADSVANVQIVQGTTGADIQTAIDQLPSGGGSVFIPAGTYTVGASIVLRSFVKLQGAGEATVLVAAAGMNGVLSTNTVQNEGIVVRDLRINANGLTYGIDLENPLRCRLENITIENTTYRAVRLNNFNMPDNDRYNPNLFPSYSTLENVRVFSAVSSDAKGITLHGLSHITLSNCIAQDMGHEGFWGDNSDYITVVNCQAIDNGETGFKPSYGSDHWTFSSCIARGNKRAGFEMPEANEGYHTFTGCIAENNGTLCQAQLGTDCAGFWVLLSKVSFSGCYAQNNTGAGISLHTFNGRNITDVSITGGVFENNTTAGIILDTENEATGEDVRDVTISGIRSFGNPYGIDSRAGHYANYDGIVMVGNDTRGNASGGVAWDTRSTGMIVEHNLQ